MIYEKYLDSLMKEYTSGEYQDEVAVARAQFAEWAGVVDEESPDFEHKMAQFVDWFLFSRPLKSTDLPPAQKVMKDSPEFLLADHDFYERLSTARHSLFKFLKIKKRDVYIKDLFSGYKFIIKDSDIIHGFEKDVLFEARIIPHEDTFIFTGAFCFHPPQVNKFILKEIKKVKKLSIDQRDQARELLLNKLFKMKYRLEHYRHVSVEEIYSEQIQPKL